MKAEDVHRAAMLAGKAGKTAREAEAAMRSVAKLSTIKVRSHATFAYLVLRGLRAVEQRPERHRHPNGARAKDVADEMNARAWRERPVGSTATVERVTWRDVYPVLHELARQGVIHEVRRCWRHGARYTPRFRTIGG